MVTNQSGDRPISSLLGRRWNLGIAQRFLLGEVEQAVEPQRCLGGALSISRRSPVDFRAKLGEIAELFRALSRQWPTGDPPIPEQSPTGRRLILKILHGGRPVIGGAPKYARCPAVHRLGHRTNWAFAAERFRSKIEAARSKTADRFWTRRPVTYWSPSGDRAATARQPLT